MLPYGYNNLVLDHQVLYADGSFRKERCWLRGWLPVNNTLISVEYIYGFSGKETVLTYDRIMPLVAFDVV